MPSRKRNAWCWTFSQQQRGVGFSDSRLGRFQLITQRSCIHVPSRRPWLVLKDLGIVATVLQPILPLPLALQTNMSTTVVEQPSIIPASSPLLKSPAKPQASLGPLQWIFYHIYTVYLFTVRDWKTIMFPVSLFALVAAPAPNLYRWLLGVWWLFINLFHLNVSNQYKSGDEDRMNHPWRPIPAGRITPRNATILRWALLPASFLASVPFGWDVAACNIGLFVTFYFYDNMKGSHHWLIKSACNIPGYGLLEYGATKVMAGGPLDQTGIMSILCSITVVFTTIQTADFADVVGDKAVGRLTMPIHFPEFSRIVTFAGLVAWSTYLASLWQLGLYSAVIFVLWGSWIGYRFYNDRTQRADAFSYVLYNYWILTIHLLPAQSRWKTFSM